MSTSQIRCFIALDLKEEFIKNKIEDIQRELKGSGADLKLVERQNLHFTLRFLGEIPPQKVEKVKEQLERVKAESFEVVLKGIGVFPSFSRINVIWIGVSEGEDKMKEIYDKVNDALIPLFPKERGEYVPHLTIARVRSGRNRDKLIKVIERLKEFEIGKVRFSEFQFKKSTLTPRGPIYENLKVYPLG